MNPPQNPNHIVIKDENEYDWLSSSRDNRAIRKIDEKIARIMVLGLGLVCRYRSGRAGRLRFERVRGWSHDHY